MSDQPVNLNKARKARKRADARQQADANAVRFGRTKAEKERASKVSDLGARKLDGHKREP